LFLKAIIADFKNEILQYKMRSSKRRREKSFYDCISGLFGCGFFYLPLSVEELLAKLNDLMLLFAVTKVHTLAYRPAFFDSGRVHDMQNEQHVQNQTLFHLPVTDISPNPLNPRLIFDPDDLDELKKSIQKVGILVPVTVFRNTKHHPNTPFILLDGERRWKCAQELQMPTIPANVIDEPSDDTQNILYMFNIHHFRKEWDLFPTALKLEVIIEKLDTDRESVISEFTGVTRTIIRKCKMLLWYPHKYRDVLMQKGGKASIGFFVELHPIAYRLSHEEEYSYPVGTEKFVDRMMQKFSESNAIDDVKEFRDIRRSMGYFESEHDFSAFLERLDHFLEVPELGTEAFFAPEIEDYKNRRNIIKYVNYLNLSLKEINSDVISDLSIVSALEQLSTTIQDLLEEIE
jgi:ParB/RepB/Spo0J family partition protein